MAKEIAEQILSATRGESLFGAVSYFFVKQTHVHLKHSPWYGVVWCGVVRCVVVTATGTGTARQGRYGTVRYGTVRYGTVWYGMVWYGMVWYWCIWCMVYNMKWWYDKKAWYGK